MSPVTEEYLKIGDYAVIGNGQSAALVGINGSVDWCCWPRFDCAALFCRLLDIQRGGYFQIAPQTPYRAKRNYIGATNVLQTNFTTDSGVLQVIDWMPAPEAVGQARLFPHRIMRKVICVEGRVTFRMTFQPTFDYAGTVPRYEMRRSGLTAIGRHEALELECALPLQELDGVVEASGELVAGESLRIALTHRPLDAVDKCVNDGVEDFDRDLEHTLRYWQDWAARCSYEGPYRDQVVRSALVLKLLVFEPSGGLVAAPTAALPAEIGGQRNWDYRYTWLRDAGLVLDALQQLGYHDESMHFIDWFERLGPLNEGGLRVLYNVDGSPAPDEETLTRLEGYRGSRPVRIGNGAVRQTQIDGYGHILDAVWLCYDRLPRPLDPKLWDFLRSLADTTAHRWREPDQGPWEIRGPAKHYLYSKLYCWVGLDRAIRLADRFELPADRDMWKRERDAIRDAILDQAFNQKLESFTQTLGGDAIDASALTLPLAGFLSVNDPRMQSTLKTIQKTLCASGLVFRYRMDDGLPGHDATFTLSSYWLVMNFALAGESERAQALFDHIQTFANDVGLLSEQIDPETGELLGNFPQGFTHLGQIRAAIHIRDAQAASVADK